MTLDELIQQLNDEKAQNKQTEEELRHSDEEIANTFLKIEEYQNVLAAIQTLKDEWHTIYNSDFVFDINASTKPSVYKGSTYAVSTLIFSKFRGDGQSNIRFVPQYKELDYYKPVGYEMKIAMLNIRYKLILIHESQAEELRQELGIDEDSQPKEIKKSKKKDVFYITGEE